MTCPTGRCCPLSMLRPGEQGALVEFRCPHGQRHRLTELGLTCGDCIRVISGECHGPMIVALKHDARLALGRGMAHKIIVQVIE
ncbi:MAG: ferrous iron transport protein A [Anaerolineae bacterium]|nr:ferrous iron transport protein A [Anaerolineae bacterium]